MSSGVTDSIANRPQTQGRFCIARPDQDNWSVAAHADSDAVDMGCQDHVVGLRLIQTNGALIAVERGEGQMRPARIGNGQDVAQQGPGESSCLGANSGSLSRRHRQP